MPQFSGELSKEAPGDHGTPKSRRENAMKKLALIALTLALGLVGCASTKECDQRVAALEKESRVLRADETRLKADQAKVDKLTKANRALSRELQDEMAKGQLTIKQLRDRLTISVVEEVLFNSGSTEIHADGRQVLDRVANALNSIENRMIMVEGHTDDVPIGPKLRDRFPSNWELSAARAATVVRYLQEKGVAPKYLGAAGFSEYRALAPNDSAANRQRNRRIDVVLTPEIQERTLD